MMIIKPTHQLTVFLLFICANTFAQEADMESANAMRKLAEQYIPCYQTALLLAYGGDEPQPGDPDWEHQFEVFSQRTNELFLEGAVLAISLMSREDLENNPLGDFYYDHPEFFGGKTLGQEESKVSDRFYDKAFNENRLITELAREQYETSNCQQLWEELEKSD